MCEVTELRSHPARWAKVHRYVVKRQLAETKEGKLYWQYHVFVTNDEATPAPTLEGWHLQHADMENRIKEHKSGLGLEKLPTGRFHANWAYLTVGFTTHVAGDQPAARQSLEQCLACYAPQDFRTPGSPYDPAVLGSTTLGPVLWLLGYPEQALAHGLKGLAWARELTQPYSLIYAENLVITTRLLRGEREDIQALVEELIPLCREQEFVSYLALI